MPSENTTSQWLYGPQSAKRTKRLIQPRHPDKVPLYNAIFIKKSPHKDAGILRRESTAGY